LHKRFFLFSITLLFLLNDIVTLEIYNIKHGNKLFSNINYILF